MQVTSSNGNDVMNELAILDNGRRFTCFKYSVVYDTNVFELLCLISVSLLFEKSMVGKQGLV